MKRSGLARLRPPILAIGLAAALLGAAAPVLAKTYVVVLKNPFTNHDQVQITNPHGVFGIPRASFGARADQPFITAERIEAAELETRFGPALEAMRAILAEGLPPLPVSYASLLEHRQGPLGRLQVQAHGRSTRLDGNGAAVRIDGLDTEPFIATTERIQADFGALLDTLEATRRAGAPLTTYVALLQDPDGGTGQVTVADPRGHAALSRAGMAINLDPHTTALEAVEIDRERIEADFGSTLGAMPAQPREFILYFERGGTTFTPDALARLEEILADLAERASAEVLVAGHADTVGRTAFNEALSARRAEEVAARLRQAGASVSIEVQSHGKRKPRIPTPDNTDEPGNRRVEVSIR